MKHTRRHLIKSALLTGTAAIAAPAVSMVEGLLPTDPVKKGNVNHSVCRWTFEHLSVKALCTAVKGIGFNAIDLVGPKDWTTLKQHGVYSSMCNGAEISLTEGFNDRQYHPVLFRNYEQHIELVAKAGYKNLICFSGNRAKIDDETGLRNAAEGLKKLLPLAEKRGVVLQMELLNSKVNHPDYMCDNTRWGIELCKRVDSPNFKLLYDIYHMQVNEGDVIATIRANHRYFGHYHTAGVPGRHELDEHQELYYPAIMRAIVATGFKGYVAQEFQPTPKTGEGKLATLKKAISICDV